MGYTHYFEIKKNTPSLSEGCLKDLKKVLNKYKELIQFESDNKALPILTKKKIRFNGIKEEGHETFYLDLEEINKTDSKEDFIFNFCKTARKPYDIVVCECLLILKAELGENLKLNSDGFSNYELSFDGLWNHAIEEVKSFGYKINACVFSRDNGESLYYDCEIKSIIKEVK